MGVQRVFGLLLSIACIYSTNAQSGSRLCPLITIGDLGTTTDFSSEGLVARAVAPRGEAEVIIPVRIRDFTIVCDAAGERINTSSFVSVVVEFHCDFDSAISSLAVCSDPNNIVTRQYQFQCIGQDWNTIVSGSNLFIETENPTATLSTPLVDTCRRCIDDQQSSRADPATHCDPCAPQCNRGQMRCYVGLTDDICCNFYLQGNCTTECPSGLTADSNFNCVCPDLTLANGAVSYSVEDSGVVRDVGSVATHTCNRGYRLNPMSTRTCSTNGWDGQDVGCDQIICPDLTISNGMVTISPANRSFDSTTSYECDPGYALKGDGNRICQMDSTWSGTDPECADCSPALQDPNCAECGFDSSGMPICTMCKDLSYTLRDGKCGKEGDTSASTSSCNVGCIIGIVLAILGAIILSVVVVLVVYAVYRYLSNPATKLAKTGTEGLNGVARDNPLYLPPEEIVGDVGDVETA